MNMTPRKRRCARLALKWIELLQRFALGKDVDTDTMMRRTFKVGDRVRLKSGGLTVTASQPPLRSTGITAPMISVSIRASRGRPVTLQAAEELGGAFALRLARLVFIVCPLRDFG